MSIDQQTKQEIITKYQSKAADTGSSEVQVAILSSRISELTEHFKIHKKDNHSRVGLIRLINRRRKLLSYLKSRDENRYLKIIGELGLRK